MHLKTCFGVLLCALQINYINNEPLKSKTLKENNKGNIVKIPPELFLKTAEILHKINNGFDEEIHRYDDEITPRISIDYLNGRTDKVIPLMTLMKLVQKNYNADQKATKDYLKKNFRVYYIHNPETLQDYRKNLRARSTSSSSEDEDYDDEELRIGDRMLKTFLRDQRRNAVFRNINHTKGTDDEKDFENTVPINEYEKSNNDFKDDVWDVITKKYDWSKETKDNGENGYTSKWSDKNKDTKDWDKKQDNSWDKIDNNWNNFKITKRNKIRNLNSKPRVNEWENLKYDLETESQKLYGEDFRSILKRFRKTPDYLKILSEKVKELDTHQVMLSTAFTYHFVHMKMARKIKEMFGIVEQSTPYEATTTSPAARMSNYFGKKSGFRRDFRQGPDKKSDEVNPIEVLDQYSAFSSPLNAAEINAFKDLGFEYAGHVIHGIIKHMGPDDAGEHSTRLPSIDSGRFTTTEHSSIHEVTTASQTEMMESTLMTEPSLYKYRALQKQYNKRNSLIS
ncbi:hypothetical protein K1T71_000586 [Dendrolimus kikuchii]|uniref:Uncharacterized protein n=1 Tax=Dendrolimus kikuchii TaxID=765133 RepID=A0ACC1DJM4_9NEOP|nr:hypothetical protein K1T71_000586 [Dendrolimus kikuchii]